MIAAVSVVFPWSMCPMVPMLTCGLVRSNLALATGFSLRVLRSRACLGGAGRAQVGCWPLSPVTLAMISLATFEGTSAYESNTMV